MKEVLTNKQVKSFQDKVWKHYKEHKRKLSWRQTKSDYHIVVSEFMLQQTQVARVVPKYEAFIQAFPNWQSLANASYGHVYKYWQGLGYNRRARYLRDLAKIIVRDYQAKLPSDETVLLTLPGIGPATASAIKAFVFNQATVYLETNVRSVYLHEFYSEQRRAPDAQLKLLIGQTMPKKSIRDWYYALLDYGVYIKQTYGNPNIRSKSYVVQSKFHGSKRELRGKILKQLYLKEMNLQTLQKNVTDHSYDLKEILLQMIKENLITYENKKYKLA